MKQYLITTTDGEPFLTNNYSHDNHIKMVFRFNIEAGMVVYDLVNEKYTNDGTQWQPIEGDIDE